MREALQPVMRSWLVRTHPELAQTQAAAGGTPRESSPGVVERRSFPSLPLVGGRASFPSLSDIDPAEVAAATREIERASPASASSPLASETRELKLELQTINDVRSTGSARAHGDPSDPDELDLSTLRREAEPVPRLEGADTVYSSRPAEVQRVAAGVKAGAQPAHRPRTTHAGLAARASASPQATGRAWGVLTLAALLVTAASVAAVFTLGGREDSAAQSAAALAVEPPPAPSPGPPPTADAGSDDARSEAEGIAE